LDKKIVKKRLSNVKLINSDSSIKTVGIVFDESYFYERKELIIELIQQGINEDDIEILVFKTR